KLQCYLALKREYSTATYLNTVKDTKLSKTLTMYRVSEHHLAIERGRPGYPERRGCAHNAVWGPWRQRYTSSRNAPTTKPLEKVNLIGSIWSSQAFKLSQARQNCHTYLGKTGIWPI